MLNKLKIFSVVAILTIVSVSPAQIYAPHSEAFGDRLRVGFVGSPPNHIDPFSVERLESLQISRLVYGPGLVQQEGRFGDSSPLIEKQIVQDSPTGRDRLWKFEIKRNIIYQNGLPLRNRDVMFTFSMLKKWGGHILNRRIDFKNIKSIELSGDLEFQFILFKKDPDFLQKLTDIPMLSLGKYRQVEDRGFDYLRREKPMGYGPFAYLSSAGNQITLVSHSHFVFGRPFLNAVDFIFFRNEQRLIDNFIQGNIDLMEVKDRITAQRLHQILQNGLIIFPVPRPERKVYFLQFNVTKFPFQNSKDRVAVRRAINSNEIVAKLAAEKGRKAVSLVHPDNKMFFNDLEKEKFNPGISIKLLERNGWKINQAKGILEKQGSKFQFELLFEQNSYLEESIARAVKIYLADIGINVQPRPVNLEAKKALVASNNFTAALESYSYFEDDLFNAFTMYYNNVLRNTSVHTNFRNLTMEKLLNRRRGTPKSDKQTIQRFQIILHQEAPVVFLFFDEKILYAVQNRFQDVRLSYSSKNSYFYRLNPFENWFVPRSLQKLP